MVGSLETKEWAGRGVICTYESSVNNTAPPID